MGTELPIPDGADTPDETPQEAAVDEFQRGQKILKKVRFTDVQWKQIEKEAAQARVSVAEYIRRIIDRHLYRKQGETQAAKRLRLLEERVRALESRVGGA